MPWPTGTSPATSRITLREAWHANRRWMVPGAGILTATVALLGGLLARRQAIGSA